LARVLAWQARGDRFESDILHHQENERLCNFAEPFFILSVKRVFYIPLLVIFKMDIPLDNYSFTSKNN
jgi:hypothetical protein